MVALSSSTCRRLSSLKVQANSVWEGDRLSLNFDNPGAHLEDLEEGRDCILWVDGVNGVVRAMDLVPASTGPEAIVRALIQAMEQPLETPNSGSKPYRPQKVVVRSRELQFFLRGVLQDLGIVVEYQSELPLIDQFFSGMQQMMSGRSPQIPPTYADIIEATAQKIWQLGPWESLLDSYILKIRYHNLEEDPFYICVLGHLGMEFGVIFYRSLDSLCQFRSSLTQMRTKDLGKAELQSAENVFLAQDCLYINFNPPQEQPNTSQQLVSLDWEDIDLEFGNIHPLEGLRLYLEDEEALLLYLGLEALARFYQKHRAVLRKGFSKLSSVFTIPCPSSENGAQETKAKVTVSTDPNLADRILALSLPPDWEDEEDEDAEDEDDSLDISMTLIPGQATIALSYLPWDLYNSVGKTSKLLAHQNHKQLVHGSGDGVPLVAIKASTPQIRAMVHHIQEAGGCLTVAFRQGMNYKTQELRTLGLLALANGEQQLLRMDDAVKIDPKKQVKPTQAQLQFMERLAATGGILAIALVKKTQTSSPSPYPQAKQVMAWFEIDYKE